MDNNLKCHAKYSPPWTHLGPRQTSGWSVCSVFSVSLSVRGIHCWALNVMGQIQQTLHEWRPLSPPSRISAPSPTVFPSLYPSTSSERRHVAIKHGHVFGDKLLSEFSAQALLLFTVPGCQQQQLSITVEHVQISVSVHVFRQDMRQARRVAAPSLPHTQTHAATQALFG